MSQLTLTVLQLGFLVLLWVLVLSVLRVLRRDPATVRLGVFDRVAGGEVVLDGDVEPLPSSAPTGRVITFRLWRGEWRVASVSGSRWSSSRCMRTSFLQRVSGGGGAYVSGSTRRKHDALSPPSAAAAAALPARPPGTACGPRRPRAR